MKKRVMLILSCLFLSLGFITAQTTQISGTVIEENGEPVIGASVVVKGTTTGTITDIDGRFSLNVPENNRILVFSLVGMKTIEQRASANMNVVMESDTKILDEVMVVAYGTAKKSTFTGSANAINQNAIKDIPVVSFEQALQGAAPGLMISSSSGQPGAQQQISIRGVGSMNASTEPLYVVDGIPMLSENLSVSGVNNSQGSLGVSSLVNPADIASITVLKDAAAASLYGSRAANGVILITTKSGKAGTKTQATFKAQLGFNDWAVENRPIVSGDELRELWGESYQNFLQDLVDAGQYPPSIIESEMDWLLNEYLVMPKGGYSDWEDALFRNKGFTQNYEASVSGGNEKTQFFASLGYRGQDGKVKNSWSKQYSGRLNLTHAVNNRFNIGTSIAITKMKQERVAEGTAYANPYYASRTYLWPTIPIYNEDGSYYEGPLLTDNGYYNLVKSSNSDRYPQDVFDVRASVWAEYKIYDNLKFKQTVNYTRTTNDATTNWPFSGGNGENMDGLTIKYSTTSASVYSSSILTYNKTIDLHNFDVLLGWDVERREKKELMAVGQGFATDKSPELSGAAIPTEAYSIREPDRMLSLLSRINYDYNSRYYVSASLRRDGSSRLGENNRWGNFGSISGAWRISEESFIKANTNIFDDLKLRLSYGESGTLPSDWYASQNTYTTSGSYMKRPTMYPSRIANPDLAWEKSQTWNIGLDVRMFNALTFELDLYNKKTKDLIAPVPVSQTTGFTQYLKNEGEMTNKGIEVAIGWDVIQNKDLFWNTRVNFAHNSNKVTKIYGGMDNTARSPFITREGEAYYSFYTREFAGYNPETGAEQWYTNKTLDDGSIEREITENPGNANRVIVGKADPKLTGGWQNTVTYKGFSLSALFSFSIGGKFFDDGWTSNSNGLYDLDIMPSKYQLDRWQSAGDTGKNVGKRTYGYAYGNYTSSKWIFDSDHIRLKNLSFSYTLPSQISKKADMSSVRFIVSSSNLFTIKKTDGFDPESAYNGTIGYALPPLKDVTFGVEIAF
jgi:TonB-linked SusC/RagA family outer membrane protein